MAALEADLAPEPQAGMTQSPAPFSNPHLYQQSPLVSASSTSIISPVSITVHVQLISCIGGLLLDTAACKICKPDNNKRNFCFKKLFFGSGAARACKCGERLHIQRTTNLSDAACICCLGMQS